MSATASCTKALSYVQSSSFVKSFVEGSYRAWSGGCSRGKGSSKASSEVVAGSIAATFAGTFSAMAASICTNCPDCKCKGAPILGNQAGSFANAGSILSVGKLGLSRAIAQATTSVCANGTVSNARLKAEGIMTSFTDVVGGAIGSMKGSANSTGNAEACSGADVLINIEVGVVGALPQYV
jgi:hypothetical protein